MFRPFLLTPVDVLDSIDNATTIYNRINLLLLRFDIKANFYICTLFHTILDNFAKAVETDWDVL
jgi:predicted HAD superfamily hydrolase